MASAVPVGRLVSDAAGARSAASDIGLPVAVKAVGTGLAHKTERWAVRLNLTREDAVTAAAEDLWPLGDALLVEAMISDAVAELIVGINRDPTSGSTS